MQLHDVHQGIQKRKKRKRVGRGPGSGHGKTCGKGHKGQKSRQGYSRHLLFEGGQMPMFRRVPTRGFSNARFKKDYATVNVELLNALFQPNDLVDESTLRAKGLVKGRHPDGVKILGDGLLNKPLMVKAQRFSNQAAEKIQQAGGTVEVIEGRGS